MGQAGTSDLRDTPADLSPNAFLQPRARPCFARRDGRRKNLVPGAMAQPRGRNRAPWGPARPLVARPLAHLPAPNASHARLGSGADRLWAHSAAPSRVSPRRHAGGQRDVWLGGSLRSRHPEPVGAESLGRISPRGTSYDRVEPRLYGASLLVAVPAVVRASFPRLVGVYGAYACAR